MKIFKLFGIEIFSYGEEGIEDDILIHKPVENKRKTKPIVPDGRVSRPDTGDFTFTTLKDDLKIINPSFVFEAIPIIRKLSLVNADISQALDNIVSLGNTGHIIKFDSEVKSDQANEMRRHLDSKKLEWSEGTAGMDGVVNKMIAQVMIGGALANEWIPNMQLTGIKNIALINPEEIRFAWDKKLQKYIPLQKPTFTPLDEDVEEYIKLNENTFKYYAINGDTAIPYGIPPYLSSLDSIKTQRIMNDNIKFIVELVGIIGFLEVLLTKPDIEGDEDEATYKARVEKMIDEAKERIKTGFRDGVIVGISEEHEFEFHSITKDVRGVTELWENNELQIMSAIKQDASLLGRSYGTSETQITVVFTKLLSQLKNIQNLVKRNLEFGYGLELRLAGFDFNIITVEFNRSTLLDELKFQQATEIKIRNLNGLWLDGIISQRQYANQMGFEKPDQEEPRFIRGNLQTEEEARQKKETDKDKGDRKGREKGNDPNKRSKE